MPGSVSAGKQFAAQFCMARIYNHSETKGNSLGEPPGPGRWS
jgi:hypothetical protein